MIDRRAVKEAILDMPNNNLLIELPTGFGKTAIAIELLRTRCRANDKVLVVVPRTVLKGSFIEEIYKWWEDCPLNFTLTTYKSLDKHKGYWSAVVYDEAHHLSPRCREISKEVLGYTNILLSATISPKFKEILSNTFPSLGCYKRTFRDAIDNEVLPDPKVYLLPLKLNNEHNTETIIKNPTAKSDVVTTWRDRWNYIGKEKFRRVVIRCTQRQFISDLDSTIEWRKKQYMRTKSNRDRNLWLHLCRERLKRLSEYRTSVALELLKKLRNYRTLTFCNSIEQTEVLGKYCINSKSKKASTKNYQDFNAGKIKHITSCNMLNEGVNLTSCKVGIYAVLNSSETLIKQKLGRILRHKEPVIIIPYYENTREEEIVKTMLVDYNPDLVVTVKSIDEIVL